MDKQARTDINSNDYMTDRKNGMIQEMSPYSADILNPFSLHQELSWIQILKMSLLAVTLFPIRLLLMSIILIFIWFLGICTLWGLPENQRNGSEPILGWRRQWAKPIIVSMARFIFFVGGWYWIPQKGIRALRKEAPILLGIPHSSFLDTVVVIALGCPGMVSTEDCRHIPAFGKLIEYMQPLFVKKNDANSRRQISKDILSRVTSEKDFEQLIIFPEGGCGNRQTLLKFKLGGFNPGVPVQPVFIRYKNSLDTITWAWEGPKGWRQLLFTLLQFRIYCELEFLPVYKPSDLERKNSRIFADNVRKFVSRWTNTSTTAFSLEDGRFIKIARELHLPLTVGMIKFLRVRKAIEHQDMDPKEELNYIRKDAVSGDAEALATYLGVDRCSEALRDFFYFIDQENKGSIDFRIYAASLCLIRNDLTQRRKLEEAMEVFGPLKTAEHLAMILLIWKGIPQSLSTKKTFIDLD